jgi:hypothetical protein
MGDGWSQDREKTVLISNVPINPLGGWDLQGQGLKQQSEGLYPQFDAAGGWTQGITAWQTIIGHVPCMSYSGAVTTIVIAPRPLGTLCSRTQAQGLRWD